MSERNTTDINDIRTLTTKLAQLDLEQEKLIRKIERVSNSHNEATQEEYFLIEETEQQQSSTTARLSTGAHNSSKRQIFLEKISRLEHKTGVQILHQYWQSVDSVDIRCPYGKTYRVSLPVAL